MENGKIRIGVDFDNTIVCYDKLFYDVALEQGIISKGINQNKNSIRDYLRNKGENDIWTELQGYVYGVRMKNEATLYNGVIDFFTLCKSNKIMLDIISHKSLTPAKGPSYNLHDAAIIWLDSHGFFSNSSYCIGRDNVFFNETQEQKIKIIKSKDYKYFIDDLPEIFEHRLFPRRTKAILFDPNDLNSNDKDIILFSSWYDIAMFFFGEDGIYKDD